MSNFKVMMQSNTIAKSFKRGAVSAAFLCGLLMAGLPSQAHAASAMKLPQMPSSNRATDAALPSLSDAFLPQSEQQAHDAALDFVRQTGITRNLSLLLLHDVKGRAPVQAAIKRYGMDAVQNTVVQVILVAQNEYSADWNQMLADIYQAHFGVQALRSLTVKRDASPYFTQLLDLQDEIANAVKSKGHTILMKARADVMKKLQATLPA